MSKLEMKKNDKLNDMYGILPTESYTCVYTYKHLTYA